MFTAGVVEDSAGSCEEAVGYELFEVGVSFCLGAGEEAGLVAVEECFEVGLWCGVEALKVSDVVE